MDARVNPRRSQFNLAGAPEQLARRQNRISHSLALISVGFLITNLTLLAISGVQSLAEDDSQDDSTSGVEKYYILIEFIDSFALLVASLLINQLFVSSRMREVLRQYSLQRNQADILQQHIQDTSDHRGDQRDTFHFNRVVFFARNDEEMGESYDEVITGAQEIRAEFGRDSELVFYMKNKVAPLTMLAIFGGALWFIIDAFTRYTMAKAIITAMVTYVLASALMGIVSYLLEHKFTLCGIEGTPSVQDRFDQMVRYESGVGTANSFWQSMIDPQCRLAALEEAHASVAQSISCFEKFYNSIEKLSGLLKTIRATSQQALTHRNCANQLNDEIHALDNFVDTLRNDRHFLLTRRHITDLREHITTSSTLLEDAGLLPTRGAPITQDNSSNANRISKLTRAFDKATRPTLLKFMLSQNLYNLRTEEATLYDALHAQRTFPPSTGIRS